MSASQRRPYRVALGRIAFVLSVVVISVSSQASAQTLEDSSTSSEDRASALRAIPFDELTDQTREKLSAVVNRPDMYRRLPIVAIESDPDFYLHLVRHPEVVVDIWRLMGISQIQARRVGEYMMDANDGSGTASRIELVYGTPNLHVMYAEGVYEGPLLRNPITGRCVLILHSDYLPGEDGKTVVRNRLDVFMVVDQRGVGVVARSLQSLVGKAADHNFIETTNFLGRLSQSAEENGPGVQQLTEDMENVDPKTKREFGELAMLTHRRAQHRLTAGLPINRRAEAAPAAEGSTAATPATTQREPLRAAPSTASRETTSAESSSRTAAVQPTTPLASPSQVRPMTPAAVTPAAVTPAAVTPAAVTPAAVTPATSAQASSTPLSSSPSSSLPPLRPASGSME